MHSMHALATLYCSTLCHNMLLLLHMAAVVGRAQRPERDFFRTPIKRAPCDAHNLGVEFEKQLRFRSHFVIMEYDSRIKVS